MPERYTTVPVVPKAYKDVVRQLLAHDLQFKARSGSYEVCLADGTGTGLVVPRRSRGSARIGPTDKATLRALQTRGWYTPGGKAAQRKTKEVHVDDNDQPAVQVGADGQHRERLAGRPGARTAQAAKHPDRQEPGPARVLAPAVGRRQSPQGGLAVATGGGEVVRLPVRARTAHQHRLDHVRGRVQRVLHELGGNKAAVRGDFVRDALATAAQHSLRLPLVRPGLDADKRLFQTMAQSLRGLLNGRGQSEWMLDIWDLACTLLEMPVAPGTAHLSSEQIVRRVAPKPTPAAPAAPVAAASVPDKPAATVGVQPFASGPSASAGAAPAPANQPPTGATVGQANDDDERLRVEVVPAARDARSMLAGRAIAKASAGDMDGAELVQRRARYLDKLEGKALAGDAQAAARLEKLLGL